MNAAVDLLNSAIRDQSLKYQVRATEQAEWELCEAFGAHFFLMGTKEDIALIMTLCENLAAARGGSPLDRGRWIYRDA